MPLVLRAKCIILGDNAVGKSAIIQSFSTDGIQFPKSYTMNAGVVISVKAVQIPDTDITVVSKSNLSDENCGEELYIHDSPGKENFFDFAKQFWHNPSMVLIVYDVTNQDSFTSCSKWLSRIMAQKASAGILLGAVVANRIDLDEQRVVNREAGETFASGNAFEYFETSAKLHKNCDKPFQVLAAKFHEQYEEKMKSFTAAI